MGAQQLELTFPGELAGLSAADQSSLKADIKAAVAKASAAITEADIADVSLRAGSIVATVTFKPAVSAAAAQQAATTIAAAPVQVSVGTTTLRSTAAQAKQNAAPGLSRVRASRLAPRLHRAACGHCAFQLNCSHGVYLWQAVSDDKAGDSQAATMLDHFISMTGMTGDVSIAVTNVPSVYDDYYGYNCGVVMVMASRCAGGGYTRWACHMCPRCVGPVRRGCMFC